MSISTETLSDGFKTRLKLKTKTTGLDKIKKAKDDNDECAILSMFLPFASAEDENRRFRCALGPEECRLGNWKLAQAGMKLYGEV